MTEHPLAPFSAHVRNFKCFGSSAQGWQRFEPINVVVGRNNSGKSSLIDIAQLAISRVASFDPAKQGRRDADLELIVSEPLTEDILKQVFHPGGRGGEIPGNHWEFGQRYVGARAVRQIAQSGQQTLTHILGSSENELEMPASYRAILPDRMGWKFGDLNLLRISAERDINPKARETRLDLSSTGDGVTNVIRAFINSDQLPTGEITEELLSELNEIYKEDSEFDGINCQESDDGIWEVFLHEKKKGNIRLSQSGSSLKTIFLTLSFLRLYPHFKNTNWPLTVFCIEEPENNLHPALLRRFLEFLAAARQRLKFTLVLTTHSPICIDWAAKREDSQIVHITHDGDVASTKVSIGYKQNRGILDDLDVRASDILQSNGVIWVEGPSDRVYINKWIDIFTSGELKEGLHYQIMFYAGKLLSHLDALPTNESDTLISLLLMNRNIALVMDSDRHLGTPSSRKPRMNLNQTKRRIRDEIDSAGGYVWITEGREIENYLSIRALRIMGHNPLHGVGMYDKIPESRSMKRFKGNKIELAVEYSRLATQGDLEVLDLQQRVAQLVAYIARWNSLSVADHQALAFQIDPDSVRAA